LFPNPATRDGNINIRWKKPVNHDQQVIVFNTAGVKVSEQTITCKQGQREAGINLNLAAAGVYVIHLVDSKTHKTLSAKLVVE
jgi:DNA-binding beta-propeller fold protein YncE